MRKNRREFLRSCCGLGAATVAAHLSHLAPISAIAQSASSDYKALVCLFFFGGNDANNMIVPIDSRYAAYQSMRGPVALAQGSLLPAGSSGYGLHPALIVKAMEQLRTFIPARLWRAAVVAAQESERPVG